MTSVPATGKRPRRPRVGRVINGAILVFVATAYFIRLDALYAITIYPPVLWSMAGLILSLVGARRSRGPSFWLLLFGWILFFLAFADEPHRWAGSLRPIRANDLRVVTLNCAGGTPEAAAEAMATKPPLVLLQESPGRKEIEKVSQKAYGRQVAVLAGIDASIVADGRIEPITPPRGTNDFVAARVYLQGRPPLFVVSLRMLPPEFRLDYWSPDCWQAYAENHALHRRELAQIAAWIRANAGDLPILVGGDMNAPPDPAVFKPFAGWLQEATQDSGYTAVNEFPLARIDQIWVRGLEPVRSEAVRTVSSDHRMVRCALR